MKVVCAFLSHCIEGIQKEYKLIIAFTFKRYFDILFSPGLQNMFTDTYCIHPSPIFNTIFGVLDIKKCYKVFFPYELIWQLTKHLML